MSWKPETPNEFREKDLQYACPFCGAAANVDCSGISIRTPGVVHFARRFLRLATEKKLRLESIHGEN